MLGLIVHIINYEEVLPVSSSRIPYATIQKKMLMHGIDGREIARCRLGGVGFIPVKVFKISEIIHVSEKTLLILSKTNNGHTFADRWKGLVVEAKGAQEAYLKNKENEEPIS